MKKIDEMWREYNRKNESLVPVTDMLMDKINELVEAWNKHEQDHKDKTDRDLEKALRREKIDLTPEKLDALERESDQEDLAGTKCNDKEK
jgi:hypothetical protein